MILFSSFLLLRQTVQQPYAIIFKVQRDNNSDKQEEEEDIARYENLYIPLL